MANKKYSENVYFKSYKEVLEYLKGYKPDFSNTEICIGETDNEYYFYLKYI